MAIGDAMDVADAPWNLRQQKGRMDTLVTNRPVRTHRGRGVTFC